MNEAINLIERMLLILLTPGNDAHIYIAWLTTCAYARTMTPTKQCAGHGCAECKNARPEGQSRRAMMSWLLGGGVAASLGSFFYPVLRFLNPPQIGEVSVNEVAAGKVDDLKPNSGKIVKFGNKPALLVRTTETEWKAFSAVCTHLNCTVQYQDSTRQIWCACHNGTYDMSGRVVSGPPPKPLEEYAVNVRGDEIVISKRA